MIIFVFNKINHVPVAKSIGRRDSPFHFTADGSFNPVNGRVQSPVHLGLCVASLFAMSTCHKHRSFIVRKTIFTLRVTCQALNYVIRQMS